jgi:hypothetical protein
MMMNNTTVSYTSSEIMKALDINRSTFQDWLDRKFIIPSVNKSKKQGDPNLFSKDDLYSLYLFIRLARFGLSRSSAADASKISWENAHDKLLIVSEKQFRHDMKSGSRTLIRPSELSGYLSEKDDITLIISLSPLIEEIETVMA